MTGTGGQGAGDGEILNFEGWILNWGSPRRASQRILRKSNIKYRVSSIENNSTLNPQPSTLSFWFKNHPLLLLPVNCDHHGLIKADMTDKFIFINSFLSCQEIQVVGAVIDEWVNGEIAHAE